MGTIEVTTKSVAGVLKTEYEGLLPALIRGRRGERARRIDATKEKCGKWNERTGESK